MTDKLFILDPATAHIKLDIHITRTELQLTVVKQVIESLKSMDGKQISKRIATALAKQYPSLRFTLNSPYSWYNLDISGNGFDEIHLQLAYKSEPGVINIERITELNQRYLLDEVRLVNYRNELVGLEERIERYNAAIVELYTARKSLGDGRFTYDNGTLPSLYDKDGWFMSDLS